MNDIFHLLLLRIRIFQIIIDVRDLCYFISYSLYVYICQLFAYIVNKVNIESYFCKFYTPILRKVQWRVGHGSSTSLEKNIKNSFIQVKYSF